MRLWSVHPRFLDAKGLVALWREGLLARKVLDGGTRGYRHHPQLDRFRERTDPVRAIDIYLSRVFDEAGARGYSFAADKIDYAASCGRRVPVTSGQLALEWQHLRKKLRVRDPARFALLRRETPAPHPLFVVAPGPVAPWERAG